MVINMTKEHNNKIFNAKLKKDYLKDIVESGVVSESTAENYERFFVKTANFEEKLKKDLNQFTFEEMETVLFSFNAGNRHMIDVYARIISSYLNWSVKKGLSEKNVLAQLKTKDFEKYVVNKEEYITEKRMRRYEDMAENYQDSALLRLLFIGVNGKNLSELRFLEKEDIDFDKNLLKLKEVIEESKDGEPLKYKERYMSVDDRTIYLLRGAIEQRTYLKKNGNISQTANNVKPYIDLVDNKYVLRPTVSNNLNSKKPVNKHVLQQRLRVLADSLGIDHLNSKFIQRSGMIYYASQLVENGNITKDDRQFVGERFNVKSYLNLRSYLTIENIRRTYPEVFEGVDQN